MVYLMSYWNEDEYEEIQNEEQRAISEMPQLSIIDIDEMIEYIMADRRTK